MTKDEYEKRNLYRFFFLWVKNHNFSVGRVRTKLLLLWRRECDKIREEKSIKLGRSIELLHGNTDG